MKIKKPLSNEKSFSHGIILAVFIEKRIFKNHLLKGTFILDWEPTLREFIVALLMHDGVDDVEEHFLIWPNCLRTNGTTQFFDNFKHDLTSLIVLITYKT
jgi:hypothetical protein